MSMPVRDRRRAPGRAAACPVVTPPVVRLILENVFRRIGRGPVPCQSGISMSHLKTGGVKEMTVSQSGINRFSGAMN